MLGGADDTLPGIVGISLSFIFDADAVGVYVGVIIIKSNVYAVEGMHICGPIIGGGINKAREVILAVVEVEALEEVGDFFVEEIGIIIHGI